jgi:hypothetical protein
LPCPSAILDTELDVCPSMSMLSVSGTISSILMRTNMQNYHLVIVLKRLYNFLLLNLFRFYNNVYFNPFFEEIPKSSGRQMRSEY